MGEALYDMKTYPKYLSERDSMPAYTYLKKVLQFLQWSDKVISINIEILSTSAMKLKPYLPSLPLSSL